MDHRHDDDDDAIMYFKKFTNEPGAGIHALYYYYLHNERSTLHVVMAATILHIMQRPC